MKNDMTPRPEYPRPQLVREDWLNLNGIWGFQIDHSVSGRARGLVEADGLDGSIRVPFCPESALSGVEHKDFMRAVWYKRAFEVPASWSGSRVLLHFGAVDYATEVWMNGRSVGSHLGGYSSFSFDITSYLTDGGNLLTLCAEDDVRSGLQPRGKQSAEYHSHGCDYTRTTGIWQTVWLEKVPAKHIKGLRISPDALNGAVHVEAEFNENVAKGVLVIESFYSGQATGTATVAVSGRGASSTLQLSAIHLWEIGSPCLYDLRLSLVPEAGAMEAAIQNQKPDHVTSYFGLRDVSWDNRKIRINGRPVYQRLILDQGFYPDGIYTAPTDDELRKDIERSMAMGFNGARLHQKMFEERFLYWADRMGYLVWGEHASWGLDITGPMGLERFLPEWMETMKRDFSHPSIVGWCPFNETGVGQDGRVLSTVYAATKAMDPTRPVIDTSGYVHVVTDIYDVHDYDQNVASFAARYAPMAAKKDDRFEPGIRGDFDMESARRNFPRHEKYEGQPYFVSEFGGIWWNPQQTDGKAWGYGDRPASEAEFLLRYEGLVTTLLDNPGICAFCYTQLTDVEQEVNGLYTDDRRPKFDPEIIRRINSQEAAIEKEERKG